MIKLHDIEWNDDLYDDLLNLIRVNGRIPEEYLEETEKGNFINLYVWFAFGYSEKSIAVLITPLAENEKLTDTHKQLWEHIHRKAIYASNYEYWQYKPLVYIELPTDEFYDRYAPHEYHLSYNEELLEVPIEFDYCKSCNKLTPKELDRCIYCNNHKE